MLPLIVQDPTILEHVYKVQIIDAASTVSINDFKRFFACL